MAMQLAAVRHLLFSLLSAAVIAVGADDIVKNETQAMAMCMAYSHAQEMFRRTDYDRDGVLEFAQTLMGGKPAAARKPNVEAMQKPAEAERVDIARLIGMLGAPDFAAREAASAGLLRFGVKAYAQLLEAQARIRDAEVVMRSKVLSQQIIESLSPEQKFELRCGLLRVVGNNGVEYDILLIQRELAEAECPLGTDPAGVTPFGGYLFRILTQQGAAALGGARSYLTGNNMNLGYALLAFPKDYGVTGKKCFIISNHRLIYSRDFGDKEKTDAFVKECIEFNPVQVDATDKAVWKPE
ncbi:MAG TPA: DUF2950 family protein [Planctomycetota bacterium]|nr:DUF2950 family protein [Planctomycetota bacterium]